MPDDFLIVGHRGARGLYPENTIEGFRAALAMGLKCFEIDIAVTADGVPVLYHDLLLNPDITRDSGGIWLKQPGPPIRALRLPELTRFDVGRIRPASHYAALYPDQHPVDGARIPTLTAVLAMASEAWFAIELKTDPTRAELTMSGPEMAERVLAVAEAAGALGRICVQSFDWRGPRHLRRVRPGIPLAWLTEPKTIAAASTWWGVERGERSVPEAIASEGGGIWTPENASLERSALAQACALGLKVIPWTVNEPSEMMRLREWGAAGLTTDRPDLAMVALGRADASGERVPAPPA
ncbi:MAG: glycerophosphodiester phosphodiesterase family protein [Acetobacteraceae bacterium]